ncbi:MAG: phosphoribosylanthranilate isomerase [Phycisphaerales bacterium]|nr:phosphoribosylanthranilate isomerase [Phycisphaerales bacterium]
MRRTRIKICGITRPQDAALASQLGADAIGMIFHPASRRCVSLERAGRILAAIEPMTTPVGLFVDATVQSILETVRAVNLNHVQLHGHESPEFIADLQQSGQPMVILKAIRVDPAQFAQTLDHWRKAIAALKLSGLRGLVLETPSDLPGGTGQPNDWTTIASHQQSGHAHGLPPLIAAGGLTPHSVAGVIEQLHPYAVDVSSGVEEKFGEKSEQKLRDFFAAVRSTERQSG